MNLTLTELEATTSLRLTRLLALYLTGVASQESVILQVFLVLSIYLDESAGNSETQSLALASEAATVEICLDVIFLSCFQQVQRLNEPVAAAAAATDNDE